ncbi:hypothetical protein Ccrd_019558 [Cynara cardunculus var. scolymus]|uniref:Uncharacterized protein n=1 Tax=Cynara cardunculus var. scolymus TaxID=59895 RepID=A0A118K117_CYNCS|nr:hypothetical protein Ccrd_019558 [Cynara cardunculus var. scolymus]
MDPYYEQRLRDEVIYLHSLWHRGPLYRSLPYTTLQPYNSTNFKKHKKKSKSNARQSKKVGSFSGKEWPVKPLSADPPLTQSGWPELKLKPNPQQTPRLPTPEDLEKFKDCIALVQHSISIAKTKKLRSHRAYGQVVCKVLGWDIDRLPSSIVADYKGNGVNADKDVNNGGDNAGLNKNTDNGESNLQVDPNGSCHDVSEIVDDESMVCEGNDVNVDKDVNNDGDNEGLNKIIDNEESNLQVNPNGKGQDVTKTIDAESMVCEESVVNNGAGTTTTARQQQQCSCRLTDKV